MVFQAAPAAVAWDQHQEVIAGVVRRAIHREPFPYQSGKLRDCFRAHADIGRLGADKIDKVPGCDLRRKRILAGVAPVMIGESSRSSTVVAA